MKPSTYWKKRFEQLEQASNNYGVSTYREVEKSFDAAQRQIQKEIEAWYGRIAKNNNISIQEARKMLTASEMEEFKWDVQEYIKYGHEMAMDGTWIKELENASAKYHISRLEALKIRTQQAAEVAFGNELDAVDGMARQVFTEGYYHTAFEIQKGFNIGWNIGQIDERKLEKIISKPWAADGKNFSSRIWESKQQLINELHIQLTRACVLGKAPDDAINAISKRFGTTKHQAGRLVMTEQAYFHSVAQQEAFNDLNVEEFEIVATLDSHTSPICQEMDGKHFLMKEYQPGSTAPPFHPYCRSVTVPYFEDNYGGERIARDDEGNTYYVPDDMTYKEWLNEQQKFAKKYDDFDVTENGKYSRIIANDKNEYADQIEHDFCTQRFTAKESNQLWDKDSGYIQTTSYDTINKFLRGLTDKLDNVKQKLTINILKRVTKNNTLRHNLLGFRKVDVSYLSDVIGIDISQFVSYSFRTDGMGRTRRIKTPKNKDAALSIVGKINKLVGTEQGVISDKAFTSVSLCENLNYFTHYPIKFEIQMPSSTRGLLTSNIQESEFIIQDGSSIEILGSKVYNDNGDYCIIIYGKIIQ